MTIIIHVVISAYYFILLHLPVSPGMKRSMEDSMDDHNGGAGGDGPSLKKRRGEGPHVECRILLASKVSMISVCLKLN